MSDQADRVDQTGQTGDSTASAAASAAPTPSAETIAVLTPPVPPKRGPGRPKDTPEIKELKAAKKLAQKIAKEEMGKLAYSYGIGKDKISESLSVAERQGLIDAAADVLATRLLPKSIAVWEQALNSGNIDVATRVIEGMAILGYIQSWKKPAKGTSEPEDGTYQVELEHYRAILTKKVEERFTTSPPGEVIEAEKVNAT